MSAVAVWGGGCGGAAPGCRPSWWRPPKPNRQKRACPGASDLVGGGSACLKQGPTVRSNLEEELVAVASDWDRAMVTNDAEAIGQYMTDDWIIIGPDARIGDKVSFLE